MMLSARLAPGVALAATVLGHADAAVHSSSWSASDRWPVPVPLGPRTTAIASVFGRHNPDATWKPSPQEAADAPRASTPRP